MTILITGYSGFVGRQVLPKLVADGHRVICFGRSPLPASVVCEHVAVDLGSDGPWDDVPWDMLDAVLHLASAGVKASRRAWPECFRVNLNGTARLLTALAQSPRLQRVVLTPTFYERLIPKYPELEVNPYIGTKNLATHAARLWSHTFKGELSLVTLFQVYGPGDNSGNVLSYVATQLKRGEKAQLGSGQGLRDWIYIDDVADALVHIFRLPPQHGVQSYDLGSGELHTIRHLVESISHALNAPPGLLNFDPNLDRSDGGVELAATHPLPGWSPRTTLTEGIQHLIHT